MIKNIYGLDNQKLLGYIHQNDANGHLRWHTAQYCHHTGEYKKNIRMELQIYWQSGQ